MNENDFHPKQLGSQITKIIDRETKIALIGIVSEQYPSEADIIRTEIYHLFQTPRPVAMADLGNFYYNKETGDFSELKDIILDLIQNKITPICFGESEQFLLPLYEGLRGINKPHALGMLHSKFRFSNKNKKELNDANYLAKIYQSDPTSLLNFAHFGLQSYFVNPEAVRKQKELLFDVIRLGEIRDDMKEIEPHIRGLDLLSVNIQSIRHSDCLQSAAGPNGLYAEELAQIMRYAGMSDQMKCIGFFGYRNENLLGAKLFAQAIYCFIDAFSERKRELPNENSRAFQRFIVQNDSLEKDIVFLKSANSGRWWLEIPSERSGLNKIFYTPCSHKDYETALRGELPERWIQGFNT